MRKFCLLAYPYSDPISKYAMFKLTCCLLSEYQFDLLNRTFLQNPSCYHCKLRCEADKFRSPTTTELNNIALLTNYCTLLMVTVYLLTVVHIWISSIIGRNFGTFPNSRYFSFLSDIKHSPKCIFLLCTSTENCSRTCIKIFTALSTESPRNVGRYLQLSDSCLACNDLYSHYTPKNLIGEVQTILRSL